MPEMKVTKEVKSDNPTTNIWPIAVRTDKKQLPDQEFKFELRGELLEKFFSEFVPKGWFDESKVPKNFHVVKKVQFQIELFDIGMPIAPVKEEQFATDENGNYDPTPHRD